MVFAHTAVAQTRSPHRQGPHGLEGWTESYPVGGQGDLPEILVIARNKKIVRRISEGPFVWKWIFVENGKSVAFETGPLHFSLTCELMDLSSGQVTAAVDCFRGLPADAPRWAQLLEASNDSDSY